MWNVMIWNWSPSSRTIGFGRKSVKSQFLPKESKQNVQKFSKLISGVVVTVTITQLEKERKKEKGREHRQRGGRKSGRKAESSSSWALARQSKFALCRNFLSLAPTRFLDHLKMPTDGALSTKCLPSPSH